MPSELVRDLDQLTEVFRRAEKPASQFRIGMEAEKFGIHRPSLSPLAYDGPRGIHGVFQFLQGRFGYEPQRETEGGPIIALLRDGASITLEPAAQVELSGAPHADLHAVKREYEQHLRELCAVTEAFGVDFVHVGFHPLATQGELPWVPKRRYPIMAEYLPAKGSRGLDMMRRTATVQANLDYESEADAMRKLVVLSRLSAVIGSFTMNAPFIEGRISPFRSERQDVWQHMDSARSGALPQLWDLRQPRYRDYVEWALDAGMFLFYRGEKLFKNTGQTFREFFRDGFEGERPTLEDWKLHLGTLFPEVRLKTTLELRCCDCLPPDLAVGIPALALGLTADSIALDAAEAIALRLTAAQARALALTAQSEGLRARVDGLSLASLAEQVLDVAQGGLVRRARFSSDGADEGRYLASLQALVQAGQTPADSLLARLRASNMSLGAFVTQTCCVRKD